MVRASSSLRIGVTTPQSAQMLEASYLACVRYEVKHQRRPDPPRGKRPTPAARRLRGLFPSQVHEDCSPSSRNVTDAQPPVSKQPGRGRRDRMYPDTAASARGETRQAPANGWPAGNRRRRTATRCGPGWPWAAGCSGPRSGFARWRSPPYRIRRARSAAPRNPGSAAPWCPGAGSWQKQRSLTGQQIQRTATTAINLHISILTFSGRPKGSAVLESPPTLGIPAPEPKGSTPASLLPRPGSSEGFGTTGEEVLLNDLAVAHRHQLRRSLPCEIGTPLARPLPRLVVTTST